ncbi:alpha-(1-_3)-arabinofuranosyltransferase [Paractinoplanes abujensis]|uniref:Arabinofuranan 3-O-arabinosyltransferase n=1 Tax=Paractinoplanes abujensis TaxID=882441 RepID=A0A7W7CPT8_9ACTN|nr:alpha-(1->3)-arabinofuranosyltransferase [Actinoplanes abujensis]MBB4692520.1 arabinofuranan 3-O-arabinosyltransferase [Actinoplanes abujensis]GID22983.1 alpha-(1->3)-arabinofuranosyltransferase [Actinoplanes abujensis]
MRLLAVCAGLTAIAFLQSPGSTAIDTKVDLVIDPAGWLSRALHVWDPAGTFGQLQNQAYGYLWPMGPFFLLGKLLAIPAWVVQRLWWALLLSLAFTGLVLLAERLRIGTPWARIIAGVAFALSPRILTELGPISVEAWPTALAPWVLIPLIGLRHPVPIRRAVTRSALVVACAGGVNATAVLAVVPLAVLWLAGLRPARLRWRALVAWGAAVAAATAWWLVPLLLLGRYSPPFLDYIETAAVTTAPTDTTTVLRGASHWHAYLTGAFGPLWPAGWRLATETVIVVATLVVAGLGLAGLSRRGVPHRWFLVSGMLAGLALVGLGHVGAIDGLFADAQRAFLDGPGAPLRNVHKFDVVLRLPLVLGLAHLLGLALRSARTAHERDRRPARLRAATVTGAALVAMAGVASPALAGGVVPPGSFAEVPGYWRQAATWLDRNLGHEQVLVVPGARFPQYLWGRPSDEITQALMKGNWGVRNSIPLTPPGTIRLLDSVEEALSTGSGSPGLAPLLSRSGVRYLLLRSDLNYGRAQATEPIVARQALLRSPGLTPVATFGPAVGGGVLPGFFIDDGLDVQVPALEVWRVDEPGKAIAAYDSSSLTTVVGGPESLLDAAAAGKLPDGPTVLAGDRPDDLGPGPVVLTDGMRRREVAFGMAADRASATLEAGQDGRLGAPARDYLPAWGDEQDTVVRYLGIKTVRASSAYSEANALIGSRPAHQPFAALDGNPATSWRSAPGVPSAGQWLEVELPGKRVISSIGLTLDQGTDSVPTRITVRVGPNEPITRDVFGTTFTIPLPGDIPADTVRVTVDAVRDVRLGYGGVGFTDLSIPGVVAQRTLAVPASPVAGRPVGMVFSAAPSTPACYFADGRPYCSGGKARDSEDGGYIDRTAEVPQAALYTVSVRARPKPGAALNAMLDPGGTASVTSGIVPSVTASSSAVPDPAARPGAVADGDPATTWYASDEDSHPWLRLGFLKPRQVNGIRVRLADGVAASRIWQVTVLGDTGVRTGYLDDGGSLRFDPPLRTGTLTVLFANAFPSRSLDPYRDTTRELPIGVSELSVLDDPPPARNDPDRKLYLRCGTGPSVSVAGVQRSTALVASRRELVEGREVATRLCGPGGTGPVRVATGPARVVAVASSTADPLRLNLTPLRGPEAGQGGGETETTASRESPVRVDEWTSTTRRVHLDASPSQRVLAMRENTNPGWTATLGGEALQPLIVDGWQQGWIVPAGPAGDVTLRFAPDQTFGIALGAGAVLLTGVAVAAVIPSRRPVLAAVPVRRRRRWLLPPLVGGAALLIVGGVTAAGLIALGLAVVVALRALRPHLDSRDRKWLRGALGWARFLLPAALFALAGWASVTAGNGHTAALPQLAAVAAGVALWLSVLFPGGRRRRK